MKKLTNKTILKQGDKTYQPIEIERLIYWVSEVQSPDDLVTNGRDIFKPSDLPEYSMEYAQRYWQKLIAQSQPKLDGIPVVSLNENILSDIETITSWDSFKDHPIGKAGKKIEKWFKSNPNQYTQEDIERAVDLAQEGFGERYTATEIIEELNSIQFIEVDGNFNFIGYK
jgi:hypothetical protein